MLSVSRRALSALALAFALVSEAPAGAPTERLDAFFDKLGAIMGGIHSKDDFHDRLPAIRREIAEIFDARVASERVLGREWPVRTAAEQDEFVSLFAGLLERAFLARVGSNVDVIEGLRYRYLSETVDTDRATVVVAMVARGGAEVPIEYRMVKRNSRWGVSDVVLDGVSLVANYGAQFSRVLGAGAYPDLVARMRAKVVSAPGVAGAPPRVAPPPARPLSAATSPVLPVAPGEAAPEALAAPAPAVPLSMPAGGAPPDADQQPAPPRESVVAVAPPPSAPTPSVAVPLKHTPTAELAPRAAAYWVQVGAFRDPDLAATLAARLRREHDAIVMEPPAANGRPSAPLFRVRVGPFADRASAITKLQTLRSSGFDAFVVSER